MAITQQKKVNPYKEQRSFNFEHIIYNKKDYVATVTMGVSRA